MKADLSLIKGVIEILSSIIELGGLNSTKIRLAIAPTSVAYTMPYRAEYIANLGVGLLFYLWNGHAKA